MRLGHERLHRPRRQVWRPGRVLRVGRVSVAIRFLKDDELLPGLKRLEADEEGISMLVGEGVVACRAVRGPDLERFVESGAEKSAEFWISATQPSRAGVKAVRGLLVLTDSEELECGKMNARRQSKSGGREASHAVLLTLVRFSTASSPPARLAFSHLSVASPKSWAFRYSTRRS